MLLLGASNPLYNQIDSIWIGNSPEPCITTHIDNDTCYRTSGWVGPMTDTIRGIYGDPNCNPNCYFVVVYYERFDTLNTQCYGEEYKEYQDDEVQSYYPFISGIYWYGEDDCYECESDKLELYFIENFYKDAEEEMPGIINNLSVCYFGGIRVHCEGIATQYYTIGKCYDNDGKECDKGTQRCCTNRINVNSDATDTLNRQVDSITYFPGGSGPLPPCPGSCEDGCDPKKKSLLAGLSTCAIPCNEGLWIADSSETITIDSLLTGCSGCTIKIHYSYRNNNNPSCPDNYKDARFDSISYDCLDNSCIDQLTPEEMVAYVNEWLLKYSIVNNVPLGGCRDNYRLVNALCVTDFDTISHTGLGDCNPLYNDQLGCCWGRYLVCQVAPNEYTAVKIDGSEMIGDTCVWFTRPCIPICDNVYNSIMSDPNDPFGENTFEDVYRAMETIEKAESYVVSSVNEGINVYDKIGRESKVLIYDLFGKLVGNENTLPIMYQHLVKGTYFITVKVGNNVLKIYKIYIEK